MIRIDLPVAKRAAQSLAKARAKPHFGNAGEVVNMLSEAVQRQQSRDSAAEAPLTLADFGLDV